MDDMPKVPDSTKSSLAYKLAARARDRWPQLASVEVTHRAGFAYVTGALPDAQQLPLCRLRYGGSASIWGFAIYRASHDDYQPNACHPPAAPRTPSTPPAVSTSTTPPPGPTDPRRTNGKNH